MTPSAAAPSSRTCSGLDTPNPTATGTRPSVAVRIRLRNGRAVVATWSRAPVTPKSGTTYRNAVDARMARSTRGGGVFGLTRKQIPSPRVRHQAFELRVLPGRQVGDDERVGAGRGKVIEGRPRTMGNQRVHVAHRQQRFRSPGRAQRRDQTPRAREPASGRHRRLPRRGNDRAIGHRIAEGNPDLEDVGPAIERRGSRRQARQVIRVAGHEVGDESRAPGGVGVREGSTYVRRATRQRHGESSTPATMSRSLSPRPERFTTTIAPADSSVARRAAATSACDDSSAGRMPA